MGRDLCLIKTNENFIEMASNMGGRLLEPRRDTNDNLMEGAACWMAGWGDDLVDQQNNSVIANSHPYLNESGVNAIGRDYCVAYSEPWIMNMSGPNDFCAGNPAVENGMFVTQQPIGCNDRGIPLICDDGGFATLVGISRGMGECMPENSVGLSNVMVRVGQTDNYSWIFNTMRENEPQPGYEDALLPMPSTMTCSRPSVDNSAKIFSNGDISQVQQTNTLAEADRYTAIVEFAPDSSTNDVISSTCYGAIISPFEVVVPAECCLNAFMTVQASPADIIGYVKTGVSSEFNDDILDETGCLAYNQIEKVDIHPNHMIVGSPTSQVQDNVCVVKVSENMFDMYEQQGKPNCAAAACLPSEPLPHGTACWVPVMVDDPNVPNSRYRISEGWNILGDAECNDFNLQMASLYPNTLAALTSGSQDEANLFCAAKPVPGAVNMGDTISAGTDWKTLDGKGSPMFCLESTPIGDRTVVAGLYYLNTLYKTGDPSAIQQMHADFGLTPADFIDLSVLSTKDFIPTANDAFNNPDMSPLVSSVASYYPWNYEVGTGWEGFSTCEAQVTGAADNPDWSQNLDPYRLTVQMGMVKLSFKII